MSYQNFRPLFVQRGAAALEIYARHDEENNSEIVVKRKGACLSSDAVLELDRYMDRRFFNVNTVQVWLYNIQVDSVYIQSRIDQDHDVNSRVYVEDRYTNGI